MTPTASRGAVRRHRCTAPSRRPDTTAAAAWAALAPVFSSGPSAVRGMRSASSDDVPNSTAAVPTTAASVAAPAPSSSRMPKPSPKPTPNAPVPTVGVTALAVTSSRRSTVLGRAAPSPARMNRLTVSAASTRT